MGIVVFDPVAFKAAYPQFAAIANPQLQNYFDLATMYLSNTECSVVQDVARRSTLLDLLTAHVGYLSGALNPGGLPGLVGRVSGATEGSVSVTTDFPANPNGAWFNQTAWGAMFWQATLKYRGFNYRARATRF